MGWFLVNILLPAVLPLAFLSLLLLVDLPNRMRQRARIIRAVQDGQLGWVSMGFAASCTYDLLDWVTGAREHAPLWAGLAFAVSAGSLAISGFLATLGTLFPVEDGGPAPRSTSEWVAKYRLLVGTIVATVCTAVLWTVVHFVLPGHPG